MRIESNQAVVIERQYKPISVTLTFDTEDELVEFYLLCKHASTIKIEDEIFSKSLPSKIRIELDTRNRVINEMPVPYETKWNNYKNLVSKLYGDV